MENEDLITLQTLCEHYQVEVSFIESLDELGLVTIRQSGAGACLDMACLADIERLMRLHYDLDINLAGIDAISHLLNRVHNLQKEVADLKNKIN